MLLLSFFIYNFDSVFDSIEGFGKLVSNIVVNEFGIVYVIWKGEDYVVVFEYV